MNSETEALRQTQTLILKMLKNSQTKVIFPVMTFALLEAYAVSGKDIFTEYEIRLLYNSSVRFFQEYLGHNMHIGGKFYDAYPIRNLPRYGVLSVSDKKFYLSQLYKNDSHMLVEWIPGVVKNFIDSRIGIIPKLADISFRIKLSEQTEDFKGFIEKYIDTNPANFEIFSFAIIKIHLEKFACKIYRDTRTSAFDKGVDLSTNYGAIYQIKHLKLMNLKDAQSIYSEINSNFDEDRISEGKIIIVIDDISKDVKKFLINMKIQSLSKKEIVKLAEQIDDLEDRLKVLRVIYEEFRRDYESQLK